MMIITTLHHQRGKSHTVNVTAAVASTRDTPIPTLMRRVTMVLMVDTTEVTSTTVERLIQGTVMGTDMEADMDTESDMVRWTTDTVTVMDRVMVMEVDTHTTHRRLMTMTTPHPHPHPNPVLLAEEAKQ